jgi:NADH:ubiquinone oxidoreductase subunit 6 (subunit J)
MQILQILWQTVRFLCVDYWAITLPLALGLVAIYWLLPRATGGRPMWGAAAAGVAIVIGGCSLLSTSAVWPEALLFYVFSAVAVLSGGLLVTQQNPVHAALSFALVVLSTCGLFLLQSAPFLMAATVVVYAGAIVVTFLFVIMLAQQAGISNADQRSREPFLSSVAGFVLLGALLYVLVRTYDTRLLDGMVERVEDAAGQDSFTAMAGTLGDEDGFLQKLKDKVSATRGSPDVSLVEEELVHLRTDWPDWKRDNNVPAARQALEQLAKSVSRLRDASGMLQPHEPTRDHMSAFSVPQAGLVPPGENVAPLGRTLFTDYLLAVELGGTLLLVATIGAIAIAGRRKEGLR